MLREVDPRVPICYGMYVETVPVRNPLTQKDLIHIHKASSSLLHTWFVTITGYCWPLRSAHFQNHDCILHHRSFFQSRYHWIRWGIDRWSRWQTDSGETFSSYYQRTAWLRNSSTSCNYILGTVVLTNSLAAVAAFSWRQFRLSINSRELRTET